MEYPWDKAEEEPKKFEPVPPLDWNQIYIEACNKAQAMKLEEIKKKYDKWSF